MPLGPADLFEQLEAIAPVLSEATGVPIETEKKPEPRPVDCGSCTACCYMAVYLTPWDDASQYLTDPTGMLLAKRPDGGCVYLDERGCSIHARRPTACRAFHCGIWHRLSTPEQRDDWRAKAAEIGNTHFDQMLAEGQKRR
jgi:Fe-S-cluster containining protein